MTDGEQVASHESGRGWLKGWKGRKQVAGSEIQGERLGREGGGEEKNVTFAKINSKKLKL